MQSTSAWLGAFQIANLSYIHLEILKIHINLAKNLMETRLLIRLENQTSSPKTSPYGSTNRKISSMRRYSMRSPGSRQHVFAPRSTQLAQSSPSPESLAGLALVPTFPIHSLIVSIWSPQVPRQARLIPSQLCCPSLSTLSKFFPFFMAQVELHLHTPFIFLQYTLVYSFS